MCVCWGGVIWRILLMSLSLLLQQCLTCLSPLGQFVKRISYFILSDFHAVDNLSIVTNAFPTRMLTSLLVDGLKLKTKNKKNKKTARGRRYPIETITDTDHADDLALFRNTPAQAEYLLHCLEEATRGIDVDEKSNKIFMYFKQEDANFSLNYKFQKLVDHFTYLASHISHTHKHIYIYIYIYIYIRSSIV